MVILVNCQKTTTLTDIRRIATVHRLQLDPRTHEVGGGLNQEPFMLNSDKAFPFILSLP